MSASSPQVGLGYAFPAAIGQIEVLINTCSLPVDLGDNMGRLLYLNTIMKLVKKSTEYSAMLTARLEETKSIVKAHGAGELPISEPHAQNWFLLCRQQQLQNTALYTSCSALTEYVYRLHSAMVAQGAPVLVDPVPPELLDNLKSLALLPGTSPGDLKK
ncbi:hypothetical protein BV20DRAFT_959870 [Pilatotrama ljubarskyi]|nr:hypothetical protein BV20DRAFT_959870 [Pilatotrama ljubarskyi]